jgi:hypothetical protein
LFEPTWDGKQLDRQGDDLDKGDPNALEFDPLINAQVILAHKDGDMMTTVFGQKRDVNGNLVGHKHKVPTLDS